MSFGHAIGDQPTHLCEGIRPRDCWKPHLLRKVRNLSKASEVHERAQHSQGLDVFAAKPVQSGPHLVDCAYCHWTQLKPKCRSSGLHSVEKTSMRRLWWIPEDRDTLDPRLQLRENLEPLRGELTDHVRDTGDVAPRLGIACDEALLDRITDIGEDNGYCLGGLPGSLYRF